MGGVQRWLAIAVIAMGHLWFQISMIPTAIRIVLCRVRCWLNVMPPGDLRVSLSVPFGSHGQTLDVYDPREPGGAGSGHVILFIYGGAWGSGRKWNYTLMAAEVAIRTGATVLVPDYRTFPSGSVDDMVADVSEAVAHAVRVSRACGAVLHLAGHSAGAHLSALSLVRRAANESREPRAAIDPAERCDVAAWSVADVATFVGLSGPYDIEDHYDWETGRGVEEISPMKPAMGGRENFARHSPVRHTGHLSPLIRAKGAASSARRRAARITDADAKVSDLRARRAPRAVLVHGDVDEVVPPSASDKMHRSLFDAGVDSECVVLPGVGHSELVVALMCKTHPHHEVVMSTLCKNVLSPPPAAN